MNLTSFLLERLDEEETRAQWELAYFGETSQGKRRVDMCQAKREMAVDLAEKRRTTHGAEEQGAEELLQMMAAQYDEHPDYDEEWRPPRSRD